MAAKKTGPYIPYSPSPDDVRAIQALVKGEATPGQQIEAIKLIVERLSGAYDVSYRPDSARDTDFAEGKRFVGLQIIKLTKVNPEIYKPKNTGA